MSRRVIFTPYEIARILGKRAEDISKGAPPRVEYDQGEKTLDIAEREFVLHKIPYMFKRHFPNGITTSYDLESTDYFIPSNLQLKCRDWQEIHRNLDVAPF